MVLKLGNVLRRGLEVPLEFVCIHGVVHHIPKLKEDAKTLSRSRAIPLHRALDAVAQDIGVVDGWHAVIFKKWAYHNDGHIYQFSPVDQPRRIRFDALADPAELSDGLSLKIEIAEMTEGGASIQDLQIKVADSSNVILSDDIQKHLDTFLKEKTLRAGCIFAIRCADSLLEARQGVTLDPPSETKSSYIDGQDGP
jgi:hypothetical protein